ncbi:MAG: DUF4861 domain-containing protein [Rikenellaceae bacterium]|nr:DUF4861 domain-containing protein [Rikenellaceae bacterium]
MRNFKFIIILCSVALLVVSCRNGKNDSSVKITITNESTIERIKETVEIPWEDIVSTYPDIAPNNVIVLTSQGEEIPSQVIFHGDSEPRLLIFQTDVNPKSKAEYRIKTGSPSDYKQQAYGRFVPERMDDYAWENNLVAFRIYGPALESELVTNGIDYWSKSTSELIIDKWYAEDDYHNDTGEGCDCYKVGLTLGSGASAPYIGDSLWMSRNFASWETLDNGPIRTTVKLTYKPFAAGEDTVSFVKIISLDANTRFNKMTDIYSGEFGKLPVAAGIALHEGCRIFSGPDYVAIAEPASDSHMGNDGDIFIAVLTEGFRKDSDMNNILAVKEIAPQEPFIYYMGAATTKELVINTDDDWERAINRQSAIINNPLKVTVK